MLEVFHYDLRDWSGVFNRIYKTIYRKTKSEISIIKFELRESLRFENVKFNRF